MRDERLVRYPAVPAPRVVDATGAGDVFLAALMVEWLLNGDVATSRALRFAAAAGSCAVAGAGIAGVPTEAQVAERLRLRASSGSPPGA
jgi:2-dehydro-3-deoxygluconokinase